MVEMGMDECMQHTECSSCLTSRTVPSLNVHFTISVSAEAPLRVSLLLRADQKSLKFSSLIMCHTLVKLDSMTADSVTKVEVGIGFEDAIVSRRWCRWTELLLIQ